MLIPDNNYAIYIESNDTWLDGGANRKGALQKATELEGVVMEVGPVTTSAGEIGFAWFPVVDKKSRAAMAAS